MAGINEQSRLVVDVERGLIDDKSNVVERSGSSDIAAPIPAKSNESSKLGTKRSHSTYQDTLGVAVSKVLGQVLRKSHLEPLVDDLPPDGGLQAWAVVFFTFQTGFNTFGFLNSYGILQNYYVTMLDLPPSTVSCKRSLLLLLILNIIVNSCQTIAGSSLTTITEIGSLYAFLMLVLGAFAGRLSDAGYFHQLFFVGTTLQIIGFFTAAISTTYWQILLAHGVCLGIAGGLIFVPTMSIAGTYFSKKRPLALAITALGNSVGGLVFAAILQNVLPSLGYAWAMRTCGFVVMATSIPANFVLRPMKLKRARGLIIDWGAFKELEYSLFCTAIFLTFLGMWVPVFYLGSFGWNIVGIDNKAAASLILIINGVGVAGRIVPALLASRLGPLNLMIPLTFLPALILFCWASVHTQASLLLFDIFYGFLLASGQGMLPPSLGSLTKDLSKMGVRLGMVFSICGFALLIGQPLAGALIEANGGGYLYAQMYSGTCMMLGVVFMVAARTRIVGWNLKVKI
ncbi:related to monocarboxylate transporter [Rhynchosporium secalis]|uniref:Related to monocarboxylate transporter n=1 Tax=Rhynchosporium secalis TaxID=38038 RepID=A0A1E1ME97_RHYSE|nr:related to monocarboxylate transporter [Rhynchosporium secalis]